jgi:type VI secretion system protein ImpC
MADPKSQQDPQAEVGSVEVTEFDSLLRKEFKPKTDEAKEAVERAVRTLAEQALSQTKLIGSDVIKSIEAIIAQLDKKLTEQINLILHHPDFQKLEGAWRGLHYLVNNTETDEMLKIRFMNISKLDLGKTLKRYKGTAWDQSPLFKKVYEAEFGQLGGQPFGSFICDYSFNHTAPDIEIMKGLSKIGAAAHCPFLAAADSQLLGMESWQELSNPRDLAKQFDATEYMAWRAFRDTNDSRYMALTMPRFLGRTTYGANTEPVEEFGFEEDNGGGSHSNYLWLNAAYALGVRITEAFKTYGWCTRIRGVESGGTVEDLPTAMFPTDDGSLDAKCPTEIAISDRREAELSKAGLMALIHRKNTNQATFIGAQTLHAPKAYEDPAATASANLSARLPYIFASCRFAHFLKCMVRDWVGSTREAPQLTADLQSWILQYVDPQPDFSSEEIKARKPLKAASIQVIPDEENPGYYRGVFRFIPHYQLEGMDVSLSMVSRLPKPAA